MRYPLAFLSFVLYLFNTMLWVPLILLMAVVRFLNPFTLLKHPIEQILNQLANAWVSVNHFILQVSGSILWNIQIPKELSTKEWYLVLSNHQSWVDILILQNVLHNKIPFLKFFLKKELVWVPILGLAWWALDFPFMKRYSKAYLKKKPHKKGKDFETTRKACEKFKKNPISIMNFPEGSRFNAYKKKHQNSPFKHLLKPKAGGIGYVITLMGNEVNTILDVTIDYPSLPSPSFFDLMSGKLNAITVHIHQIEIPLHLKGNYIENREQRKIVHQWLNQLWFKKDQKLEDWRK
jgi:1-acyl-sn-glycerol-3-phosphate acyltransferase